MQMAESLLKWMLITRLDCNQIKAIELGLIGSNSLKFKPS